VSEKRQMQIAAPHCLNPLRAANISNARGTPRNYCHTSRILLLVPKMPKKLLYAYSC